jgi:PIN domain nuclease of toxin-antitoxin system
MILADTHTLLWLRTGEARLGAGARRTLDEALRGQELAVSAMTFWEVAMLKSKGRLDFPEDVGLWRREVLGQGVAEIPIDGEIGIRANALPGFHADPADRIIVATALGGHQLLTADDRILGWSGDLNRLDARE